MQSVLQTAPWYKSVQEIAAQMGMCQEVVLVSKTLIYTEPSTASVQQWHTDLQEAGDIVVLVALSNHEGMGGTKFLKDLKSCEEVVEDKKSGRTIKDYDVSKKYTATYQKIGDAAVFYWQTLHWGMGNNHATEPRLLLVLNYSIQQTEGSTADTIL